MADLVIQMLKFAAMLFAFALIPFALIFATPFVMLWPRRTEDESWGTTVRSRYGKVMQGTWLVVEAVNAITGG